MNTEDLINNLKNSDLYAECTCGGEFKLSDVLLFDGTKPFPENALAIQKKLQEELKQKEEDLKTRFKRATTGANITAKAVNVGKLLEKVLPTMKNFSYELPDCRFLGDPVDFITFKGLSRGKVDSISFVEVKSGNARLNPHQKDIKNAIEDKKLKYGEFNE